VTITGTAVNRSKKVVCWSNRGINLGDCVLPSIIAIMANTVQVATKATARKVDIAELNFNDSATNTQLHFYKIKC